MSGEQFHFVFPEPAPSLDALFFTQEGASSIQVLRMWKDWPRPFLALTGPPQSGVSTVLKAWSREVDGKYLGPEDWMSLDADALPALLQQPLALDDVERVAPPSILLTLINLAMESRMAILLGGHNNPAKWHVTPQDLVSRLSSATQIVLPQLDEASFDRRLRAACLRRFIDLPPETVKFARRRLEKSYAAIEAFAEALNRVMGSQNKPASVPVAREVLASLSLPDDDPDRTDTKSA